MNVIPNAQTPDGQRVKHLEIMQVYTEVVYALSELDKF